MIFLTEKIFRSLELNAGEYALTMPGGKEYTGKDLLKRANIYRTWLNQERISEKQAVLFLAPLSANMISCLLAMMAGGLSVHLPPSGKAIRFVLRLLQSNPNFCVLLTPSTPKYIRFILKFYGARLLILPPPEKIEPVFTYKNTFRGEAKLVTYSSGSTGNAKKIIRTDAILNAQHVALTKAFPRQQNHRDFPLFPAVVLHNLAANIHTILPDIKKLNILNMNAATVIRQIKDKQAHTVTGNVFYFKKILDELGKNPVDLSCVKGIGVGGSPVPEYLHKALKTHFTQADIYVIYGSSEAEPISIRQIIGAENPVMGYCVGVPNDCITLKIDPQNALTINNENVIVGEIMVSGANVVLPDDEIWFRTGDYGYMTDNGQLYLTARKGNSGVFEGIQHYQIEHVLQHLAGIKQVAACYTTKGFCVYITGQAHKTDIIKMLDKYFPANICKKIIFRKRLPVDGRHQSKILYHKLK